MRNEGHVQIPRLPLQAIRGHLCFCCLQPAKLTRCGGCKRAIYYGKKCQELGWKVEHKKDCEILREINKLEREETGSAKVA